MLGDIGRRLLHLFPVLLAVTLLTFLIASLLPGDLAYAILGDQATPDKVAALRAQMGLDQPIAWRYLHWLGGVGQGRLGRTFPPRGEGSAPLRPPRPGSRPARSAGGGSRCVV